METASSCFERVVKGVSIVLSCVFISMLASNTGLALSASSPREVEREPGAGGTLVEARVTDGITGKALAGVSVRILPGAWSVASDAEGRVRLPLPAGWSGRLVFSLEGYRLLILPVGAGDARQGTLEVKLWPLRWYLDEVLVRGKRFPDLGGTSVVGHDRFERLQALSAAELSELFSEVYSRGYGGLAGVATASLRGSSAEGVTVVLDGVKLNDFRTGVVDLGKLPLLGVKEVALLGQGASSELGSGAAGGVLSFSSQLPLRGDPVQSRLKLGLGSFGTRTGSLVFSGYRGVGFAGGVERVVSAGDYPYTGPGGEQLRRENASFDRRSAFLGLKWGSRNFEKRATFRAVHLRRGSAGSIDAPYEKTYLKDRDYLGSIVIHRGTAGGELDTHAYYRESRQEYHQPEGWVPTHSSHLEKDAGASARLAYRVRPWARASVGLEWDSGWIESSDLGNVSEWVVAPEFELVLDNSGAELSWSHRFERRRFYDWAQSFTGVLGLTTGGLTVRCSVAGSYRAPTLSELYWRPVSTFASGDPLLVPERGLEVMPAVFWGNRNRSVRLAAFRRRMSDQISWAPGPDGVWRPENIGRSEVTGFAPTLAASGGAARCEIGYSYEKAVDRSAGSATYGKVLPYRPLHKLSVTLALEARSTSAVVLYNASSRRFADEMNTNWLGGISVLDLSLEQRLLEKHNGDAKLRLAVRNVFDRRYMLIDGYPVPGREIRLEMALAG